MKRSMLAAGLVLWALAGAQAQAQSGAVRGKIVDDKGEALVEAKVTIEYQGNLTRKFETKTNKRGEYTQVGLPVGDYKITATKDGFQGAFATLRVGLGEPVQVPEMKLVSAAAAQAAAQRSGASTQAAVAAAFKAAFDLTQAGKLDEAEAAYNDLLAKNPGIPEVHYNLGYIAGKRKDHAAAEAAYKKAIELKPEYSDALVALVETYQAMGQADKANETLAKAVADFPDDAHLLYDAAVFHFNGGRPNEALPLFKKVEELDPQRGEVHYFMGSLSIGQNDVAAARTHFEKYLASTPTNAQFKATAEGLLAYLKSKK